jgi:hypothetical protein
MAVAAGEPPPGRGGACTFVGSIACEHAPEIDRDPDTGEILIRLRRTFSRR